MNYSLLNQKFKKSLYFSPEKERRKRIIGYFLFLFLLGGVTFYFSHLSSFSSVINVSSNSSVEIASAVTPLNPPSQPQEKKNLTFLPKDKKGRINILLIGIPGKPWPAAYLTDSIEVISIDPKGSVLVIGIPRDLLVKIPGSNYETRINALFSIEQNPEMLEKKVKEITGLEIHYWAIIDLATIKEIIDTLGGIEVDVKEDIFDPRFPTISRGYETFSIKAGHHHLNGDVAIKYIRSRHQPRGDFGRIERQQQVMDSIRKKVIELNLFSDLPKILGIFKKIKGKTNIGPKEIETLTEIGKNLSTKDIHYFLIDAGRKDSLLVYGKTILGRKLASVLWPKAGRFDYSEIREKISNLTETAN